MSSKKNKIVRAATLTVALGSALALLAGCSGGGSSGPSPDSIKDAGVLRVATLGNNAPWSNLAASGDHAGFDIELARAIAEDLGVDVEFSSVDGPGRVAALQSNQADVTIGEFSHTDERDEVIDFSKNYVWNPGQYMVRADSGIDTVDDLNDPSNTVCIQQGGTATQLVPAHIADVNTLFLPSVDDCFEALKSGQADAMSETRFTYISRMDREPGVFKVLDGSYGTNRISVGVQDGATELQEYINDFLTTYQGDGRLEASFQSNFGIEMPAEARPDWFAN